MKRFISNEAGAQAGLGLAVTAVVTLITILFNILGAIACGAVVGMMAGATGRWRWQMIPLSLVFPGVMMAYLLFWKTDLPLQKSILMCAVCFGVFWLTYLATFAMFYFEKKREPAVPTEVRREETAGGAGEPPPVHRVPVVVSNASSSVTDLDELQGTWSHEIPDPTGHPCRKVIAVDHDKVAVSIVTDEGKIQFFSQALLSLERLGPFKIFKIFQIETGAMLASADLPCFPSTWVYRISGNILTLAENFEETVRSQNPVLETYVRTNRQADFPRAAAGAK